MSLQRAPSIRGGAVILSNTTIDHQLATDLHESGCKKPASRPSGVIESKDLSGGDAS